MPYIKQVNRPKFKDSILAAVKAIYREQDSVYVRGEYFAYWADRITRNFVGTQEKPHAFNSNTFNTDKLKELTANADRISALLTNVDPIAVAGDMNYVISTVYWGVLGDAEGIETAGYGFRAYLKGSLKKIEKWLYQEEKNMANSQKETTLYSRRVSVALGVVSDIIDECYEIKTRVYEDQKIVENGLLWMNGKLIIPTEE